MKTINQVYPNLKITIIAIRIVPIGLNLYLRTPKFCFAWKVANKLFTVLRKIEMII